MGGKVFDDGWVVVTHVGGGGVGGVEVDAVETEVVVVGSSQGGCGGLAQPDVSGG